MEFKLYLFKYFYRRLFFSLKFLFWGQLMEKCSLKQVIFVDIWTIILLPFKPYLRNLESTLMCSTNINTVNQM